MLLFVTHLYSSVRTTIIPRHNRFHIQIVFSVPAKDYIYKDFLHFSVNHPDIQLSDWKTNISSISYYDPLFKSNKQIYNSDFTISLTASVLPGIIVQHTLPMYVHCTYYQKSAKKLKQILIQLPISVLHKANNSTTIVAPVCVEPPKNNISPEKTNSIFSFLEQCADMSLNAHDGMLIKPLSTYCISFIVLLIAGSYCIQKSTHLTSRMLQKLCTIIGTITFALTVFLLFKICSLVDQLVQVIP